jgi:hypothetical protein
MQTRATPGVQAAAVVAAAAAEEEAEAAMTVIAPPSALWLRVLGRGCMEVHKRLAIAVLAAAATTS